MDPNVYLRNKIEVDCRRVEALISRVRYAITVTDVLLLLRAAYPSDAWIGHSQQFLSSKKMLVDASTLKLNQLFMMMLDGWKIERKTGKLTNKMAQEQYSSFKAMIDQEKCLSAFVKHTDSIFDLFLLDHQSRFATLVKEPNTTANIQPA